MQICSKFYLEIQETAIMCILSFQQTTELKKYKEKK